MPGQIGKIIEKRLGQIGMTKSEFARRINQSRQNINDILSRKSIDTDLLFHISVALDYDFFQYYVDELNENNVLSEPAGEYAKARENVHECEKKLISAQSSKSKKLKFRTLHYRS